MKFRWIHINIWLIVASAIGGYTSLSSEHLRGTGPDMLACLAVVIAMAFFAFASVYVSVWHQNVCRLQKPSWDRNPLRWWADPLQPLFIMTYAMSAAAIGALVRALLVGSRGFWTAGVYASFAVGLTIGQLFAYRTFRERIERSSAD